MAIYKGDSRYFSCYSLKLKDFLIENDCEIIDTFRNIETEKRCWVFLIDDKVSALLTEWSLNRPKT